eukprot:2287829-Rhodomonas_salina.1
MGTRVPGIKIPGYPGRIPTWVSPGYCYSTNKTCKVGSVNCSQGLHKWGSHTTHRYPGCPGTGRNCSTTYPLTRVGIPTRKKEIAICAQKKTGSWD